MNQTGRLIISLCILLLFPAFLYGQDEELFWEKEQTLARGTIGKTMSIQSDKQLGLLYSINKKNHELWLIHSENGDQWNKPVQLVPDFFSNNNDGVDFSGVLDSDDLLYIAYRTEESSITIATVSYPYQISEITILKQLTYSKITYLPRLFIDSKDDLHLFVSQNDNGKITLHHQKINKESGEIIYQQQIAPAMQNAINPMITEVRRTIQVIFQAKDAAIQSGLFYNIVLATSKDQGENWVYTTVVESKGHNNQRPYILNNRANTYITWEQEDDNFINHIFYKSFVNLNNIPESKMILSSSTSEAHDSSMLFYNNTLYAYWYDDTSGRYLNNSAQIIGDEIFSRNVILEKPGRSHMIKPILFKGEPVLFWLQSLKKTRSLYLVKTDTSILSPEIIPAKNIPATRILNKNTIALRWSEIKDNSGLEGYRYVMTQSEKEQINKLSSPTFFQNQTFSDLADGLWYFKIKAYDKAGNESEEAIYTFTIDTTPPQMPVFIDPALDDDGTLKTNSPVVGWEESGEPVRYYRLFYQYYNEINPNKIEQKRLGIKFASRSKRTRNTLIDLKGLDNGTLLVGLQSVDSAENRSRINWRSYILNDYIPVTFINKITSRMAFNGDNVITITGRGYSDGGDVGSVIIDRDQQEPWDYQLSPSHFKVTSDRVIHQTKGIEIEDGTYYLAVEHPLRGISWYQVANNFSGKWLFRYKDTDLFQFERFIFANSGINLTTWLVTLFIIICILIFILLFYTTFKITHERVYIRSLLVNLEENRKILEPRIYTERKKEMRRKGMGLTLKYTFLILMLVIVVVSATSVTLSALALRNERINLAREMRERASLVMRNYEVTMLDIFTLQKGFSNAVDATISTSSLPDVGFVLFRQAGDDDKTTVIRYGDKKDIFFKDVDLSLAKDDQLDELLIEGIFTDQTEIDIQSFRNEYEGKSKVYPTFDPVNLEDSYIFIKPLIIASDNNRYIGEIVIGYSFQKILDLIQEETYTLIRITLIVTLIAILISIVGSIFLATTTIRPIRRISKHVNVISNTDDYEKLAGTENEKITITSRDEIGILADSINDMTSKLIEKAKADKQLMLGKEIQKKFLPLEPHETDYIDIFGFYEGAKGVSGDFFDFKILSEDYYAFIICDVAGKAVPAALIMVQISTIFNTYFSDFSISRESMNTVNIVNTINDTVEEKGFAGRFAAILVGILNIKTGKMIVTNAGYTQLLVYRKKLGRAEWIQLDVNSGAAGVFPADMLPNPYVQENVTIERGDIIMLFSDGIEEARNGKTFTNENGEETPEEFGLARIKTIIDQNGQKSPREVITTLIDEQDVWREGFEQYDDLTILGIKRK